MAGVVQEFTPLGLAFFKIEAVGIDAARYKVVFYAVYAGYSDYAYSLTFDPSTCKINHMIKVWNDAYAEAHLPPPNPPSPASPVLTDGRFHAATALDDA